jgi:hypothetical protein
MTRSPVIFTVTSKATCAETPRQKQLATCMSPIATNEDQNVMVNKTHNRSTHCHMSPFSDTCNSVLLAPHPSLLPSAGLCRAPRHHTHLKLTMQTRHHSKANHGMFNPTSPNKAHVGCLTRDEHRNLNLQSEFSICCGTFLPSLHSSSSRHAV